MQRRRAKTLSENPGKRALAWIMAGTLATFAFLLNYELEKRFDRLLVFEDNNVLFDTDPITQLSSLSDGSRYGRSLTHPNLSNYFHPPVRVLSWILRLGGWGGTNPQDARRSVGLLVVPVGSGLKALVVFAIFSLLGFSLLQVTLITGTSVLSFSQMIFGSIPDHWALGGLAIALSFLLAVDHPKRDGRTRWWAWLLVGTLAMGITVTNVLIVGLVFGTTQLFSRRQFARAALHTGALVLGCAVLTALFAFTMGKVTGYQQQSVADLKSWTKRHIADDPVVKYLRFPSTVANTIAPPRPRLMENRIGIHYPEKRNYQFTLTDTPGILSLKHPLGSFLFLLILAGTAASFARSSPQRTLATAALAVLCSNSVLHAIFGAEDIQYSQHYQIAVLVLLAGIMTFGARLRKAATILFGLTLVTVAINNAVRINNMLVVLEQFNPHTQ